MRTTQLGLVLSIVGLFAAGSLGAQTPDVAKTANPELVETLTKEVGVTPAQAEGGADALLGLAKSKLSADEFTKVSSAIPGTDALLKAAPAAAAGTGGALGSVAGAAGGPPRWPDPSRSWG
jgi:hypothetical protein